MIYITGGTGLVGSHLLYELVQKTEKIRALKRKGSSLDGAREVFGYYTDNPDALFSRIEWVEGDLLDADILDKHLEGVSVVYHAAALVSFDPRDRKEMIKTNINSTSILVDLAMKKNIEKFCFVSSVAAIGPMAGFEPAEESAFWKKTRNTSWYSWSKFKSEMEVWRAIAEGLNGVIVNPSIILGPGNWHRGSGRLFQTTYKGLAFYTNGMTGFVDVRDVVKVIIMLMEKEIFGERFILNSQNITYKDILEMIAKGLGRKIPYIKAGRYLTSLVWRLDWLKNKLTGLPLILTRETARAGQNRKLFSNKKIRETIDFKFIPVAETIQQVCDIFLDGQGKRKKYKVF